MTATYSMIRRTHWKLVPPDAPDADERDEDQPTGGHDGLVPEVVRGRGGDPVAFIGELEGVRPGDQRGRNAEDDAGGDLYPPVEPSEIGRGQLGQPRIGGPAIRILAVELEVGDGDEEDGDEAHPDHRRCGIPDADGGEEYRHGRGQRVGRRHRGDGDDGRVEQVQGVRPQRGTGLFGRHRCPEGTRYLGWLSRAVDDVGTHVLSPCCSAYWLSVSPTGHCSTSPPGGPAALLHCWYTSTRPPPATSSRFSCR